MFKQILKKISPSAFNTAKSFWQNHNLKKAKSAYFNAGSNASFLSFEQLEKLDFVFPVQQGLTYDAGSLKQRASERYNELCATLTKHHVHQVQDILELGCGDGMICSFFAENGSNCVALDNDDSLFDTRAISAGVKFIKTDASTLEFSDNSFDFIFNYNIYEHLGNPEKTFLESLRVLRPDGVMIIRFSPIYLSPFGFHAYKSIAVPYCQLLFSAETMKEFVVKKSRPTIDYSFGHLNKITLAEFRRIWKLAEPTHTLLEYHEIQNLSFSNLIAAYPANFKTVGVDFENFIIEGFYLAVRKNK